MTVNQLNQLRESEMHMFHALTCAECGNEYDLGDYDYLPYENYDSDMNLVLCPVCNSEV